MLRQRWVYMIVVVVSVIVLDAVPAALAQDAADFFAGIEPYTVPAPIAAEDQTPEEALAILNFAIRFAHPYENLTITYSDRAMAYTRIGDFEAAIDDWEHALHFRPDYVRAYVELGGMYFRLEQYELALENLNHALELDPESVEAFANRGLVYGRLGEYEAAVEDFTAAIELNPDLPNIYDFRGAAYKWLGEIDLFNQDAAAGLLASADSEFGQTYNTEGLLVAPMPVPEETSEPL